jgi:hypothetical protein
MTNVLRHVPFVKDQIQFQERMARKYAGQEYREALHSGAAQRWRELLADIESVQEKLDEFGRQTENLGNIYKRMALTLEDIEGLPEELIRELSISEADKLEFTITSIITDAGGILSLDKILVGLYKKTGEIHRRTTTTSRLYRMGQKGLIYSVPNRKGYYSTKPLTEQDVKRIFGEDTEPPLDNA